MTLLTLQNVHSRHRDGKNERLVLRDVSLRLDAGEVVAVWGQRRSGRSTLLRIAALIDPPDAGVVRLTPHALARRPSPAPVLADVGVASFARGRVGRSVGYGQREFTCVEAGTVIDELVVCQLAQGIPLAKTHSRAATVLERVDARDYGSYGWRELDSLEASLATIARALLCDPALLVVDEPTKGMDLVERERVMALLHSLAGEGRGVLLATGEATALSRADRALSLSDGELHGSLLPELAPVVELRAQAHA